MFTDQDRQIFPYQDGTRDEAGNPVTVYADPLEIDRAMAAALGGDVDDTIALCQEYETDAAGVLILEDGKPRRIQLPDVVAENYAKLCGAVRKAFGLKPFDRLSGQGATVAQCIRLWNAYRAWVEKKETTGDFSPTSTQASPAMQ